MSLLFMESFDGYGGDDSMQTHYFAQGDLQTATPSPRTGSHYIKGSTAAGRNISPATPTLIIGVAFYWQGVNSGSVVVYQSAGASNFQWSLVLDSDGKIRLYHSASFVGPLLEATASAVLVNGSWNYIEVKVLVHNSTGTWDVLCNGVSVLTGTGDTQGQGNNTIGSIQFTPGTNNGMDDVYVLDSDGGYLDDFIGDCKIECLSPSTGNGSNTGLTPSTGADHGALVDDLPPNDDTDYNSGTTPGVKDTYNYPSLASTGVVYAVQATARAKKTDSPTKTIAQVVRIAGADYDGDTLALGTGYGEFQQIWEKRPSDSNDWTVANVNAAEFGLKVVA